MGLAFKSADGLLEIAGGILLAATTRMQLDRWTRSLADHLLDGDADDLFVRFFVHAVEHRSAGTKILATALLLGHGLVKIGLAVALFRGTRWAHPVAMVVFGAFIAYEIRRYVSTHEYWLLGLAALDVFVVAVILIDYLHARRARAGAAGT